MFTDHVLIGAEFLEEENGKERENQVSFRNGPDLVQLAERLKARKASFEHWLSFR